MNRNPAAVIGIGFGTIWFLIGLRSLPPYLCYGAVVCVGLAALAIGARVWRRPSTRPAGRVDRALVAWSIAGEVGVGALGVVWGSLTAHGEAILPIIALAVGLHFLPLAKAFHKPVLVVTGLAMSAIALASFGFAEPARLAVLGFGAGLTLWATVIIDA
jgi:hypothetical protein